jgi:hypothetical protein
MSDLMTADYDPSLATIVTLDWTQFTHVCEGGMHRQIFAYRENKQHYGNKGRRENEAMFDHHIAGALVEFATSHVLKRQWNPTIGRTGNAYPDVSDWVDTRARILPGTGRVPNYGIEFPLKPNDRPDRAHVLGYVFRERPWRVMLAGWLWGHEAFARTHTTTPDPVTGVWFIPKPYRLIDELIMIDARRQR